MKDILQKLDQGIEESEEGWKNNMEGWYQINMMPGNTMTYTYNNH